MIESFLNEKPRRVFAPRLLRVPNVCSESEACRGGDEASGGLLRKIKKPFSERERLKYFTLEIIHYINYFCPKNHRYVTVRTENFRAQTDLFVFDVAVDRLNEESLFRFAQFAEIDVKILQRFIVRIDIVIVAVGFAEQIIGRGIENIRNLDDLFERRPGTADLPTADGGLLYAELIRKLALGSPVFFS